MKIIYTISILSLAIVIGVIIYLLNIAQAQELDTNIDQAADVPTYLTEKNELALKPAISPKVDLSCLDLMKRADMEIMTIDEFQQIITCHKTMFADDKVIVKDPGNVQSISLTDLGKWGTQASLDINTDKTTKLGKIIVDDKESIASVEQAIMIKENLILETK